MKLHLTITDRQFQQLLDVLRISPEDHAKIMTGGISEYGKRVMMARNVLGLDNSAMETRAAGTIQLCVDPHFAKNVVD